MRHTIINVLVLLVLTFCVRGIEAQILYNNVGHIPISHKEPWTHAGMLTDMSSITPKAVFVVPEMPGYNLDAKVDSAIARANNHVSITHGLAIIYFPQGDYNLYSTISLTQADSNIVFQGEGSDKTTLIFQGIYNSHCFSFTGTAETWVDLTQDLDKEDNIIYTNSNGLINISEGDWVNFVRYRFNYYTRDSVDTDIVGQITRLVDKGPNNDWGEIEDVANMEYKDSTDPDSSLKIRKITPIKNIGLEDMKIMRSPNTQAGEDYYRYNIYFSLAVNCWVKGVESYKHLEAI